MTPGQGTPDHLERARECWRIAESADSKREAYIKAAEHIAAHKQESGDTHSAIAMALGRSRQGVEALLKWRKAGYPEGTTPFTMPDPGGSRPTDRAATSHTRQVLRDRPEEVAAEIGEALAANPELARKAMAQMDDEQLRQVDASVTHTRLDRLNAVKQENMPPLHEQKANEAAFDAEHSPMLEAASSMLSPSTGLQLALQYLSMISENGGTIADYEDCMALWREVGKRLWEHGARRGLDVSAIAEALRFDEGAS